MIGVTEARQRLTEILDQVLAGENVVVTRHGAPVAEIVAVRPGPRPVGFAAFAGAMARRGSGTLYETVAGVMAMRSVTRDREPPVL
ncbi:MAG TPA: type II toxin-antitoxin system prevent-host-death family antitoxin [Gaiella sp.]|nr:type II toxin-antitoxin system prevent-host-death family antitoxin [Gaiella sp.]